MILMTGLPAVVLGVICWRYLTDRPEGATWLSDREKQVLIADLKAEDESGGKSHRVRDALLQPRVWLLGLTYFGVLYGMYAIGFFLPTIIAGFKETYGVEYSTFEVGLLTAIPYGVAAIGMILWARHSDVKGEVVRHFAIPATVGGIGIVAAMYAASPFLAMAGVTIGATGILCSMPPFWGMPTRLLTGAAAAGGIALVNTLGNASGFVGPFLTGWLSDLTGSQRSGMWIVLVFLFVSAAVSVLVFRRAFDEQVEEKEPVG